MSAKKEGAAFPHPEKRPLGVFLIRHVSEERLDYSVLFWKLNRGDVYLYMYPIRTECFKVRNQSIGIA